MAIKTKCIFEPIEPEDGHRILITRYYPRGVKKENFDQWVSVLSPSPDLLFSYKEGRKTWEEFAKGFVSEIRNNTDSIEAIYALAKASLNEEITLLCFERDHKPCHRHLVRSIIENPRLIGINSPVVEADDYERVRMQEHVSHQEHSLVVHSR